LPEPSTPAPSAQPSAEPTVSESAAPSPSADATAEPSPPAGWSELSPSGPAPDPREDHTWTLDEAASTAYLFGGRADDVASNELWRYDLATDAWTQLSPAGDVPSARFGHVAAWAEGVGLIIWSGQAGPAFFTDVWVYNPSADAWRELPAGGDVPPARYGSCGGIGPDGRLWISHGFTEDRGRFSDTRAYDFSTNSWQDMTPEGGRPVDRCLHDCFWTADGRLVLYAGQTTGVPAIGDLWSYEAAQAAWAEAPTPEPAARQLYALAVAGDMAYVFGGGSLEGEMLDDLWQLNATDMSWTVVGAEDTSPAARAGGTLLVDASRSRLLLFGGTDGERELNDLWERPLPAP
jgi:hypothetical protein